MAMGVKSKGDLDRYFDEAKSWDHDRAREAARQKKIAYGVGAGGVLFGLVMLGWHIAAPLRSVEPYVVRVDRQTGAVDVLTRLTNTRNITVEASVANPGKKLVPGMFARAVVDSGAVLRYLTVPQTAITYNPYGTTVFIALSSKNDKGEEVLTAQQTFIKTGPTRGDQVAILSGVKEGDLLITSGQMKLKNGSPVHIDNSAAPLNDAAPTPQEH